MCSFICHVCITPSTCTCSQSAASCLQAVLLHFGAVEDPLLEGHLILEQYRAQFVSALRCVQTRETFGCTHMTC